MLNQVEDRGSKCISYRGPNLLHPAHRGDMTGDGLTTDGNYLMLHGSEIYDLFWSF